MYHAWYPTALLVIVYQWCRPNLHRGMIYIGTVWHVAVVTAGIRVTIGMVAVLLSATE